MAGCKQDLKVTLTHGHFMEYTILGRTGLKVSVAGLGCGGGSKLGLSSGGTEDAAVDLIRKAIDLGVNFSSLHGFGGKKQIIMFLMLLIYVMKFPNTQEIFRSFKPTLGSNIQKFENQILWRPNLLGTIFIGIIFSYLLILVIQGKSGEFIYFQF